MTAAATPNSTQNKRNTHTACRITQAHATNLTGSGRHAVKTAGGDHHVDDGLPLGKGLSDHFLVHARNVGLWRRAADTGVGEEYSMSCMAVVV